MNKELTTLQTFVLGAVAAIAIVFMLWAIGAMGAGSLP